VEKIVDTAQVEALKKPLRSIQQKLNRLQKGKQQRDGREEGKGLTQGGHMKKHWDREKNPHQKKKGTLSKKRPLIVTVVFLKKKRTLAPSQTNACISIGITGGGGGWGWWMSRGRRAKKRRIPATTINFKNLAPGRKRGGRRNRGNAIKGEPRMKGKNEEITLASGGTVEGAGRTIT